MSDIYILTREREILTLDINGIRGMIEKAKYDHRPSSFVDSPYRMTFMNACTTIEGYKSPCQGSFSINDIMGRHGLSVQYDNNSLYTRFTFIAYSMRDFIYNLEALVTNSVYVITPQGTLREGGNDDYMYINNYRRRQSVGHSIAYECGDGRAIYEDSDKDEVNPVKKSTRRKARGNRTEEILIVSSDKEVSIKTLEI